jgi:hypothetical protein
LATAQPHCGGLGELRVHARRPIATNLSTRTNRRGRLSNQRCGDRHNRKRKEGT